MSDVKRISNQIGFEDVNPEYAAFVKKFKPRKTTDDCYTPEPIFDVVKEYVMERYGIKAEDVVRPFWPGEDYRRRDYPKDCCVVDNPPFSIITQIVKDYLAHDIRFFLFAPYLTNLGIGGDKTTHIVTATSITYENGANVNTSFVTNLEPEVAARADPELARRIKEANDENIKAKRDKPDLPVYSYPPHVITATQLGYMANHGTAHTILKKDVHWVRNLDSMRAKKKGIFGSGFLLSERATAARIEADQEAAEKAAAEKAAAKKAAAHVWELSEREWEIIRQLPRKEAD